MSVRTAARHDVALRARVAPAPAHAALLVLAAPSGVRDGWLSVDVVDLSVGGAGFISPVFLPRGCDLTMVLSPLAEGATETITVVGRIRRVVMTDRRPAYLIGVSFEGQHEQVAAWIERLAGAAGSGGVASA